VELHELEVRHRRPGAKGHRDSVTSRDTRVGGFTIHLACAAGGEQHRVGARLVERTVRADETRAGTPAVLDDQIDDARMCVGGDTRQLRGALPQRPSDLAAGGITGMQHAAGAVRPFDRERRRAVLLPVELCAPLDQLADVSRPVLHQHLHGANVAESVAGRDRILGVKLRRIVGTKGRRDAALGVAGITLFRLSFRENENVARAAQPGDCAQTRDTAANDEEGVCADAVILPPALMTSAATSPPVRINVRTSSSEYAVAIGPGLAATLGKALDDVRFPRRRFIVSSPTVWRLHGDRFQGLTAEETILIPDGERFKTLATVAKIYDALVRAQADRGAGVVAIGGGVVGDVAGFAAATFLRGLPVAQVPTTLLAQVDSAVGGKTGVNHPAGKNLIGAFHQPAAVIVDPEVLGTLPRREFRAGLYEVVKCGVIASRPLFERVASALPPLFARDSAALLPTIAECCQIKATVVGEDERESGRRRILNFGHTAGHALEAVTKYRRFRHGEAVGYGMLVAAELACARGTLSALDRDSLRALIVAMGPLPPVADLEAKQVVEAVARDKKVIDGRLHFVLPVAIGDTVIADDVTGAELEQALRTVGLRT
jgi:3-dehydroquinate synthase